MSEMQDLLYWLACRERNHKEMAAESKADGYNERADQFEGMMAAYWSVSQYIQHKMGYILTHRLKLKVDGLDEEMGS